MRKNSNMDTSNISINYRRAVEEDAEKIYRLYNSLSQEDIYNRFLHMKKISLEEIKSYLRDPRCVVYVAEHNNEIIGEGVLYLSGEVAVVVHPSYRRRGIGKTLLKLLHEEAQKRRLKRMFFYTSPENTPVIKLASGLGCKFRYVDGLYMGLIDVCPPESNEIKEKS
ncbi:MAG: GNAT family N-acetyltransferase [Sulfolobales archaeon]